MLKKPYLLLIVTFLSFSACIVQAYDDDDYYNDYGGYGYSQNTIHDDYYQDDNYYSDDGDDYYVPSHKKHYEREIYSSRRHSDSGGSEGSRLPEHIKAPGEKVVVVDPRVHAWGAYSPSGELLRSGIATAGKKWCPDIDRPCRTSVGTFRIYSLGSFSCKSHKFPVNRGGAPMPYCMFFNGGQGLHGSYEVVDGNASHGCVRMHVDDAEWLRFNFANIGTKVIVRPY